LCDDGRSPIDNNPIENAIRPIALGGKNWLFAGSHAAGVRAAAIMSLLATAKANGHEPHAWLTDVLTRLPTILDRDIESLLPCIAGEQAADHTPLRLERWRHWTLTVQLAERVANGG
jgi:hypothetical protein